MGKGGVLGCVGTRRSSKTCLVETNGSADEGKDSSKDEVKRYAIFFRNQREFFLVSEIKTNYM